MNDAKKPDPALVYMPFYGSDWLGEPRLQIWGERGLVLRGAWIDLIASIIADGHTDGSLTVHSDDDLGAILKCDPALARELVDELGRRGICDLEPGKDGTTRIVCRRIVRELERMERKRAESEARKNRRKRTSGGQSPGHPADNRPDIRRKSGGTRARDQRPEARGHTSSPLQGGEDVASPPGYPEGPVTPPNCVSLAPGAQPRTRSGRRPESPLGEFGGYGSHRIGIYEWRKGFAPDGTHGMVDDATGLVSVMVLPPDDQEPPPEDGGPESREARQRDRESRSRGWTPSDAIATAEERAESRRHGNSGDVRDPKRSESRKSPPTASDGMGAEPRKKGHG